MNKNIVDKRTDKELIDRLTGLHDAIYVMDCFGTRDMIEYELLCLELDHRGYTIVGKDTIEITKG